MRSLILLILALLSTAAMATDAGGRKPLAIAAITAQQEQIRSDVQAGTGRYKDMPAETRNELLSRQTALFAMLRGKRSADDLTSTQRMEAFNTLEWIEAAINDAEDDRMVCYREKTLGSNRMQRVCKTAAQLREEREYARMNLNRGCAAGICGE